MLLLVTLTVVLLPCLHAQRFTGKADCTFEQGLCSLKQAQDDSWDWERRKGNDRYYKTLPKQDHSLGTGEGYFLAVRSPIMPIVGERSARLETGMLRAGRHCLTFYHRYYASYMAYNFPGTMNKLNVYVMSGDQLGDALWSIKDGDLWTKAQININTPRDFQIIFEAEVRSEFKGSIALDDISIAGGSCEESCKDSFYGCCMDGITSAAGPNYQGCRAELQNLIQIPEDSTKIEQFPGKAGDSADCDFERDVCGYVQAQEDDLEWDRLKGWSRNVQNTLPSSDQTTKKANGWFMAVQSPVRPYYPKVARLQTPQIRSWSGYPEKCLTFHYHMAEKYPDHFPRKGSNQLLVYATSKLYYDEPVFVASDVMEDEWEKVSVTFSSEKDFQIVFEAIMLSEYPGDISIDDVTVDEGSCEDRHACKRSRFGCCPDGRTRKLDSSGRGCKYVGRLGADPDGFDDETEEGYTIDKVLGDSCVMFLGEEFLDCWKRYKAETGRIRARGGRDAVRGACRAHEQLYSCYYSGVATLCGENRNYSSFKATLRRDVSYIEDYCKNGRRGRRGRARRHSILPMTPADLMEMLP